MPSSVRNGGHASQHEIRGGDQLADLTCLGLPVHTAAATLIQDPDLGARVRPAVIPAFIVTSGSSRC
jgi:hypothetical protein